MKFNDKLYQLRINKNFSQEKLAEQLLVSRQTITKWEAGKAFPEFDKLLPLSHFFGVSIDALLDESDCNDLTFKQTILKTPYESTGSLNGLMAVKRYFLQARKYMNANIMADY